MAQGYHDSPSYGVQGMQMGSGIAADMYNKALTNHVSALNNLRDIYARMWGANQQLKATAATAPNDATRNYLIGQAELNEDRLQEMQQSSGGYTDQRGNVRWNGIFGTTNTVHPAYKARQYYNDLIELGDGNRLPEGSREKTVYDAYKGDPVSYWQLHGFNAHEVLKNPNASRVDVDRALQIVERSKRPWFAAASDDELLSMQNWMQQGTGNNPPSRYLEGATQVQSPWGGGLPVDKGLPKAKEVYGYGDNSALPPDFMMNQRGNPASVFGFDSRGEPSDAYTHAGWNNVQDWWKEQEALKKAQEDVQKVYDRGGR